jgi:hypothetical protein
MGSPRRLACALGTLVVVVVACQTATGVELVLSTNVACERLQGVQVFAGRPGELEQAVPAAEDRSCQGGSLGTIVAQPPSSDRTAVAAFRVVLGVTRPVSECTSADGYAGCIVQRRELRYLERELLRLPIVMYERCIGVACDPSSTCASNGLCVSARLADGACRPPLSCLPVGDPGLGPDGGSGSSSGGSDGAVPDGVAPQDAASDATPITDSGGSVDSGSDSGSEGGAADSGAGDSGAGDSGAGDSGAGDSGSDGGNSDGGVGVAGDVLCGPVTCSGATPACCTGKLGGSQPICVDSMSLCAGVTHGGRLTCDQSADCPVNEQCCFAGTQATCQLVCAARVCINNADCLGGTLCVDGPFNGRVLVRTCVAQ